jgi:CelD/BcsL family acetyltransferase involved in cellulose biosynthesis
VEAVPADALPAPLLADGPFQTSAGWWRCVTAAALAPNDRPLLLLARQDGEPAGLLPLRIGAGGLTGLVTPYTCLFQPVIAPHADLVAIGHGFARACQAWPVLRLDALDAAWPGWSGLLRGFATAGWQAAWFDSFGNGHSLAEDGVALGWEAYLAARPGALRATIRRKLARAVRDPALSFTLARTPDEVAAALPAYEAVYRRSWKTPEPYPAFSPAFLAEAAAAGVLRLGVLARDGAPVAAQYWTVEAPVAGTRVASVLKLAHDEQARALSPGTVLTAWMIRDLLAEGVTALDFGRGDDPYKQLWVSGRRQRRGLILAQPWRLQGAAALARQYLGAWRRRNRR